MSRSAAQAIAAAWLAALAFIGTPAPLRADPPSPQCWECLKRLAAELPAVNPQEDPTYEEGLTPGSVLPALATCSLDDSELPVLRQVIQVFTDALLGDGGPTYVRSHLEQIPQLSAEDRAKLVDGARQSLDTTLRHLVDHSCRLLLRSHFDEGASRAWLLRMIELGQNDNGRHGSREAPLMMQDHAGRVSLRASGLRPGLRWHQPCTAAQWPDERPMAA